MKKLLAISMLLLSMAVFTACGGGSASGDQSTPEGALEMVFSAASSGDLSKLSNLCNPELRGDGDVKRICNAANENSEEFKKYFSKGKLNGKAEIDGDKAKVPFLFGPDGQEKETMNLRKSGDKWYLYSF